MKKIIAILLILAMANLSIIASAKVGMSSGGRSFSSGSKSYSSPKSYSAPKTYTAPKVTVPKSSTVTPKTPSKPKIVVPKTTTPKTDVKSSVPKKSFSWFNRNKTTSSYVNRTQPQYNYYNPFNGNFFLWMWVFNMFGHNKSQQSQPAASPSPTPSTNSGW